MQEKKSVQEKVDRMLSDPLLYKADLASIFSRAFTTEAIDMIVGIMRHPDAKLDLKLKAANSLLDRAFGKPAVAIRVSNENEKEKTRLMIEGELIEAEAKSRVLMELSRLGALSPDQWPALESSET